MTLRLEGIEAAYGLSQVLFGISLEVPSGRLVTLLGRNGMGKTTTVRAVMGIVPIQAGRVHFDGRALHGLPPYRVARARSLGGTLSGGEQQMLSIGRALMTNPALLILDEATEGLAPIVRAEIWSCLERLKQSGLSILLIDKHVEAVTRLADHHYVLEKGRVVWDGTSVELRARPDVQHRYLGV